jgi:hypothetical protein
MKILPLSSLKPGNVRSILLDEASALCSAAGVGRLQVSEQLRASARGPTCRLSLAGQSTKPLVHLLALLQFPPLPSLSPDQKAGLSAYTVNSRSL